MKLRTLPQCSYQSSLESWAKCRWGARLPCALQVLLQSQGFLPDPWSSVGLAYQRLQGSLTEGELISSLDSQRFAPLSEYPPLLSDT